MKETFMTRCDTEIGDGSYDSIAWIFSEHIKESDDHQYQSAMLYGNEDSPERIELFTDPMPRLDDRPARVWTQPTE